MTEYTPIIICPFFCRIKSGGKGIVCEGPIPGTMCHTVFDDKPNMRDHLDRFCSTFGYKDCPLACAAAEKHKKNPPG